ncbi:MAG TPA: asparaginase [Eoetvoesiella sp.]
MVKPGLPRIAILGTGGTIAGAAAKGVGYQAGSLSIEQILKVLPDVSGQMVLSMEQIVNVGSQTVHYDIWAMLAGRVQLLADSGEVDGIVIAHGTDTLEETAYFLSLTVNTAIPIVLTGAMRPAHTLGADGVANVYQAILTAVHAEAHGRGVLVVMNEQIHTARDIQKAAANGLAAFASPNRGPVGRVRHATVVFHGGNTACHTKNSEFAPLGSAAPAAVFVLYSHGDLDERVAQALLSLGPKGIVLAGVGDGNTTDSTLEALRQAAAQGVVIVRASRTGAGDVMRNVEINDDSHGFVAARDLNPQKARILLMLALQKTCDATAIQAYFDAY